MDALNSSDMLLSEAFRFDWRSCELFHLDSGAQTFEYSWKEVGLPETNYRLRDLWEHKDLAPRNHSPPHWPHMHRCSTEFRAAEHIAELRQ